MHPLLYGCTLLLMIPAWLGVAWGGWWTALLPAIAFGLIPLAELALAGSTRNLSMDAEPEVRQRRVYDWLLAAVVPLQVGLVLFLMYQVSRGFYSDGALIGAAATAGISCGAFGINVAHELGHHRERSHQAMAKILLLTSLYMHFFIEHNRGHHARVATPEDPASARRGEPLYGFWARSVTQSWLSAWRIEDHRLRALRHPRLTLRNEMLRFQLVQAGALLAAILAFGWLAALAWAGAALLGALLLETVNYIEHYGLQRQASGEGRYERVRPEHSWNSNHPLGRALLFDLTRHSDHHAHPGRRYPLLRHFDDSPQLPTGYPGMILLSLLPPLWFAVMHRHIDRERARLSARAA